MQNELNYIDDYYAYGVSIGKIVPMKINSEQSSYQTIVRNYIINLIKQIIKDFGDYFQNEWQKSKSGK